MIQRLIEGGARFFRGGCLLLLLQIVQEWVLLTLEGIRIARPGVGIVLLPVDQLGAFARVGLGEQALDRLGGREVRIAVVEVAVGVREVHRLVQRVDVAGAVVAEGLDVELLEDVQRLEHDRALHPVRQLVDLDPLVVGADRLLDVDLPAVQILHRDQPALLPGAAHELLGDVAAIEAVVRRVDRFFAGLAGSQRIALSLDELAQRGGEVRLAEDLAGLGSLTFLPDVRQVDLPRVLPLLDPLLVALDPVRRLRLDRVPFGHLNRRPQHVGQAESPVLGQHDQQPAWRPGCNGRQGAEVRWVLLVALSLVELDRGTRGSDAEGVDSDHPLLDRVIDERLGLATPAQHVPHRRGGRQHRTRGVHRVAALVEHHGTGGGTQRLARDRHPVAPVEHGLGRLLRPDVGRTGKRRGHKR